MQPLRRCPQQNKLDGSRRYQEAIEGTGTFSIDPPSYGKVSRLLKNQFFKKGKNTDMNAIKHATQLRIQTIF